MSDGNRSITIFSTGVHLQAVKCTIDGMEQWRWVAVGFEDDSYCNGEIVDPIEYADEIEEILSSFD